MKKVLNKVEQAVDEMCLGIVAANPKLALDQRYRVVMRKDIDKDKVALISGGGSGHEPSHAGFVGEGMLTAAVRRCVRIPVYYAGLQCHTATRTDKGLC